MANDKIVIKGAREHNLKNVNLTLPREKLIVMTGLSGSGKSSLAFDTIYADGQRRYVESLSSYARMFLGRMDKPDVDEITGLSPAISIDQKTTSHNPRSTVGTVTEIYDYLRLLYARVGVPHCPVCGRVISQQTVDEMVDAVLKLDEGTKFQVLAPVVRQRKGTQQKELDAARRGGYARVKIDGNLYDLDEEIKLEKNIKHTVEIVVDRLSINDTVRGRLADSIETAVALTGGLVIIDVIGGEPMEFSQNYACPEHGVSIDELSPRMFSFNNPFGACETCTGLGTFMKVDPARVIPDPRKSIRESAIKASGWYYAEGSISEMYYKALGKRYGFTLDTPIKEMSKEALHAILYGTGTEKIEMQRENMFGSGCDVDGYREFLKLSYIYSDYISSQEYTADEISARYAQDPTEFDFVSYKLYTVRASAYVEKNEDGTTGEITDDACTEAKKAAEAMAKDFDESNESVTDGTEISKTNVTNRINEDAANWLFGSSVKAGDVKLFEGEDVYYVVKFLSRTDNDYKTVNFLQIYLKNDSTGDSSSSSDSTTKTSAQKLSEIKAELEKDASEEKFTSLASTYSDNTTTTYTQAVHQSVSNQEVYAWLFDGKPAENEYKIFETSEGTYIVFFKGYDDTCKDLLVSNALRSEWLENLTKDAPYNYDAAKAEHCHLDYAINSAYNLNSNSSAS